MMMNYRLEIAYTLIGVVVAGVLVALPILLARRRQIRRRMQGVKDYNR